MQQYGLIRYEDTVCASHAHKYMMYRGYRLHLGKSSKMARVLLRRHGSNQLPEVFNKQNNCHILRPIVTYDTLVRH